LFPLTEPVAYALMITAFSRARHLVTLLVAGLASSCGGPAATGDAVRPKDQTAAEARGSQSVYVIEAQGQPLIVDWQPEMRGDLEVAMQEGVAVVGFDDKGLRLLSDCHLDGKYGFIGVNTKEQIVQLLSADEIKANLPAEGLGIVAKLGAELGRSQALDVAIVMVGKRKTTWATATKQDLKGDCAAATHFVRGATIGAFAMRTGAKGQARSVAEVFGASAGASVSSDKRVQSTDGLLDACRNATPESNTPPAQCGALIRLELVRLEEGEQAGAKTAAASASEGRNAAVATDSDADSCPQGFVFSNGKCSRPSEATTHACEPGDVRDCSVQCEKGDAVSCDTLGYMFSNGDGVTKNAKEALALFKKACELGSAHGCLNLGVVYGTGDGIAKDPQRAVDLYAQSCRDGQALGCRYAGLAYFSGQWGVPADYARGAKFEETGCNAGDHLCCNEIGVVYEKGLAGFAKDLARAAGYYKMSCDGGEAIACGNLAFMLETGAGMPKNPDIAGKMYEAACNWNPNQCVWYGIAQHIGLGMKPDSKAALANYEKTCSLATKRGALETQGEITACVLMNDVYGKPYTVDPVVIDHVNRAVLAPACRQGSARDCALLGLFMLRTDAKVAKVTMQSACGQGDAWACEMAKLPKFR